MTGNGSGVRCGTPAVAQFRAGDENGMQWFAMPFQVRCGRKTAHLQDPVRPTLIELDPTSRQPPTAHEPTSMSDPTPPAPAPAGPPSDVLMALYMGNRDAAMELSKSVTLTLPELAAFGAPAAVAQHLAQHPDALHDLSPDGWTALHLAAFFGYASVVVCLLRLGASHAAQSRNPQGNTPLHAGLAGRNEMAVVTALLAAGADAGAVDAQGYTALHLAASRGDQAASELLLACGARRDARSPDGKLPSDIARERGHPDLADWLQQA